MLRNRDGNENNFRAVPLENANKFFGDFATHLCVTQLYGR